MAKFLKNLFSTVRIKQEKPTEEDNRDKNRENRENKEFSTPYDTKRKLSISRSGRMKQNLKCRGKLEGDLFGDDVQKGSIKTLEYHVNKRDFFEDEPVSPVNATNEKTNDNISNAADPQTRLKIPEDSDRVNDNSAPDTSQNDIQDENLKGYISDDSDGDSVDLSKFDKDIEQILTYRESDF